MKFISFSKGIKVALAITVLASSVAVYIYAATWSGTFRGDAKSVFNDLAPKFLNQTKGFVASANAAIGRATSAAQIKAALVALDKSIKEQKARAFGEDYSLFAADGTIKLGVSGIDSLDLNPLYAAFGGLCDAISRSNLERKVTFADMQSETNFKKTLQDIHAKNTGTIDTFLKTFVDDGPDLTTAQATSEYKAMDKKFADLEKKITTPPTKKPVGEDVFSQVVAQLATKGVSQTDVANALMQLKLSNALGGGGGALDLEIDPGKIGSSKPVKSLDEATKNATDFLEAVALMPKADRVKFLGVGTAITGPTGEALTALGGSKKDDYMRSLEAFGQTNSPQLKALDVFGADFAKTSGNDVLKKALTAFGTANAPEMKALKAIGTGDPAKADEAFERRGLIVIGEGDPSKPTEAFERRALQAIGKGDLTKPAEALERRALRAIGEDLGLARKDTPEPTVLTEGLKAIGTGDPAKPGEAFERRALIAIGTGDPVKAGEAHVRRALSTLGKDFAKAGDAAVLKAAFTTLGTDFGEEDDDTHQLLKKGLKAIGSKDDLTGGKKVLGLDAAGYGVTQGLHPLVANGLRFAGGVSNQANLKALGVLMAAVTSSGKTVAEVIAEAAPAAAIKKFDTQLASLIAAVNSLKATSE